MMGEDGEYIEDENRSDKLLILKNNPEPELEPKPKTVTLKRKENENYGFAHTGTEINGKVFISDGLFGNHKKRKKRRKTKKYQMERNYKN